MSDNNHHTSNSPLLQVKDLVREYTLPREHLFRPPGTVQALNGVSFSIAAGRSLGVVGESGSGKSTLARLVMALDAPTAGTVELLGRNLHQLPAEQLRQARRDFQMVFQDPYGSLDPRQTVECIVTEPLQAQGQTTRAEQREQASQVLSQVGLRTNDLGKYPHEFSGGQRQRIAIARALITRPRLIVADEPVSALDVSVQAQVLNLMQDLQQQFGITYMLISMTSRWSTTCVTRWWCCTRAASWSGDRRASCSATRSTPTRSRWWVPCRRCCPGARGHAVRLPPLLQLLLQRQKPHNHMQV